VNSITSRSAARRELPQRVPQGSRPTSLGAPHRVGGLCPPSRLLPRVLAALPVPSCCSRGNAELQLPRQPEPAGSIPQAHPAPCPLPQALGAGGRTWRCLPGPSLRPAPADTGEALVSLSAAAARGWLLPGPPLPGPHHTALALPAAAAALRRLVISCVPGARGVQGIRHSVSRAGRKDVHNFPSPPALPLPAPPWWPLRDGLGWLAGPRESRRDGDGSAAALTGRTRVDRARHSPTRCPSWRQPPGWQEPWLTHLSKQRAVQGTELLRGQRGRASAVPGKLPGVRGRMGLCGRGPAAPVPGPHSISLR